MPKNEKECIRGEYANKNINTRRIYTLEMIFEAAVVECNQ